nr:nucleoside 2-deoxyribosyltransferase domain-containing protein [Bacteroides sp. CACC 737]
MIVLRPDEDKAEVNEAEYTKIFLAGTIDMGKSIDWQKATCDWFRARPEGKYLLYNPRRDKGLSGEMSDFEHQVNWELEHLEKADLIIMNILQAVSLPSLCWRWGCTCVPANCTSSASPASTATTMCELLVTIMVFRYITAWTSS